MKKKKKMEWTKEQLNLISISVTTGMIVAIFLCAYAWAVGWI